MQEIKGLTDEEVLLSRQEYGENKLTKQKKKGFLAHFWGNLKDPIIKVLIVALFINIAVSFPRVNWFESFGILTSILIATLVSTISEYSSENAFEKLRQKDGEALVSVKRANGVSKINESELVVKDIVILESGMAVPADITLYTGEIKVNESALTGESEEIRKYAENGKNSILKGSLITGGYAEGVVSAVGEKTFYGKIANDLSRETRPSPLKIRLTHLAKSISRLGYLLAAVTALAYLFNAFFIDTHFVMSETLALLSDFRFVISKLLGALTLAISITVVAVPEGLPMMITVVLSSNMKKMARDNVLVRKMVGIETAGNINLLFTDKTGTLTEGKLKVKCFISPKGEKIGREELKIKTKFREYLTLCANFCTNAERNGNKIIGNDAQETALLEYLQAYHPRAVILEKNPFDSAKKYSSAQIKYDGKELTLIKGAPEILISSASSYIDENGRTININEEVKRILYRKLNELTKESYRVLAFGVKEGKSDTPLDKIAILCLGVFKDKVRNEVPKAVLSVQEAGVSVVMVTGDSVGTATAIAKECGIISERLGRNLVISASELHKMSDNDVEKILPSLAVVARALPSDKTRLVDISQRAKYIVGMTGDGVNDAPSLKGADVGFAMGSGTEVAKEAADIVIKDNNFASIVKAILYGRTIFQSIRKFVQFQLIMNLSAVGISLLGPFIGVDTPVTITQMLWINIIMDTLGALAFASEPPLLKYMKEKPKKPDEKILSRSGKRTVILTSLYMLALSIWFLKSDTSAMILSNGDEKYLLSAFFGMFIFAGIFVCFLSRSNSINILYGIRKNKSFILIMLLVALLQVSFIYFGGETFRCVPLTLRDLLLVVLISFTLLIFDFIRKLLIRIFKKKKLKNSILIKEKA